MSTARFACSKTSLSTEVPATNDNLVPSPGEQREQGARKGEVRVWAIALRSCPIASASVSSFHPPSAITPTACR